MDITFAYSPCPNDTFMFAPIFSGAIDTGRLSITVIHDEVEQLNKDKVEVLFSDIEQAVLEGTVDAGLIIHESRFTYESKGLVKLLDVGEYWEDSTNSPIPLGGIAVARDLPDSVKLELNRLVAKSVQYAFEHPKESIEYIKHHAQEMDEAVMYAHIDLYVNEYSKQLGPEGRLSVQTLFEKVATTNSGTLYQDDLILP